MHISLEQIDGPAKCYQLWKVLLPKEFVPQSRSFDEIKEFLMVCFHSFSGLTVSGTEEEYPDTQVVQQPNGIEFTFVVSDQNTYLLHRAIKWLENPSAYGY
jgi:hypothetical protein